MQPFDGDIKTLYNLIILKRIYNFVGAVNFVLLFFIILGIMTFFLGLSGIELWSWLSILRSLSYVVQAIFLILSSAEVFHVLLGVTRYFNTKDKRKRTAAVGLIIRGLITLVMVFAAYIVIQLVAGLFVISPQSLSPFP